MQSYAMLAGFWDDSFGTLFEPMFFALAGDSRHRTNSRDWR